MCGSVCHTTYLCQGEMLLKVVLKVLTLSFLSVIRILGNN